MPSQPPTATQTQLQTPKHHLRLHIAEHHPQCTSPHKHRLPSTPLNTSNQSILVPPLETARAQNLTLALPCTTSPTGTERKGNAGARSRVHAHAHYAETCTIKEPGGSDPSKMWPKHRPISQRCENELLAHQQRQPCKLACSVRRKRHSMDPNPGHQVHGYPLEAHERSTLRAPQFSQEEEDREYGSTDAPPTASSNARGYSDTHATRDATTNYDAYDASYDAPLPISNAQPDAPHAYPNLSSDLINSSQAVILYSCLRYSGSSGSALEVPMVQNALPNQQPRRADKAAPDNHEELPESKVTGSSMSICAARGVL